MSTDEQRKLASCASGYPFQRECTTDAIVGKGVCEYTMFLFIPRRRLRVKTRPSSAVSTTWRCWDRRWWLPGSYEGGQHRGFEEGVDGLASRRHVGLWRGVNVVDVWLLGDGHRGMLAPPPELPADSSAPPAASGNALASNATPTRTSSFGVRTFVPSCQRTENRDVRSTTCQCVVRCQNPRLKVFKPKGRRDQPR